MLTSTRRWVFSSLSLLFSFSALASATFAGPGTLSSPTNGISIAAGAQATAGPNSTLSLALARFNYAYVVDSSSTSTATPDGTFHSPYLHIQDALNAIGTPTSGTDAFKRFAVLIAPGNYDEALTIPSARIISLIGMGPWTLGDGALSNHASTTARSITWNNNPANYNGKTYFPALEITTLGTFGANEGDNQPATAADISGGITVTSTSGQGRGDLELTLVNAQVRGNIDATGVIGVVEATFINSYLQGTTNIGSSSSPTTAAEGKINYMSGTRTTGLLTCYGYSAILGSRISGGMTIAASVQTTPMEIGMVNTEMLGAYSGGAFTIDGASYYWFSNLGGSLGSGGSLAVMNNGSTTTYTPTTSANWSTVPTTVLGALDTIASGALKTVELNGASTATNTPLVVKDGHSKSTQTTAPTTTVNAHAGTGSSCSVAHATDTAGTITLATGSSTASGDQCDVNFNKAYNVAPICVIFPEDSNTASLLVTDKQYATSTTAHLSVNFGSADAGSNTFNWNYSCLETQ